MKNKTQQSLSVGRRIKELRSNMGLSMEEFGKRLSVPAKKSAVSNWENGYNLPNNARLKDIAELAGVTVSFILTGELSSYEDAQDEFNRQKTVETQMIIDNSINTDPTIKALKGYLMNIENFDDFNIFQNATDYLERIIEYLCLLSDPNETVTEDDVRKADKLIDDFKSEIKRLSQMRT